MLYNMLISKLRESEKMVYPEKEARETIITAGLRLLETGLVARTWGNISARISAEEFVITPSGRAYDSLKTEDLVKVRIEDLSYEGTIKPSSEKGVHAAAYTLRQNVDFVIHTHQFYASAVCAEEKDLPFAPCAAYGLPGEQELRDSVAAVIALHPEANAFLMAKHGALCLGTDVESAFAEAFRLEENCENVFKEKTHGASAGRCLRPWLDDYAQMFGLLGIAPKNEDPEAVRLVREKNMAAAKYVSDARPLGIIDTIMQHAGYKKSYSKLKSENK